MASIEDIRNKYIGLVENNDLDGFIELYKQNPLYDINEENEEINNIYDKLETDIKILCIKLKRINILKYMFNELKLRYYYEELCYAFKMDDPLIIDILGKNTEYAVLKDEDDFEDKLYNILIENIENGDSNILNYCNECDDFFDLINSFIWDKYSDRDGIDDLLYIKNEFNIDLCDKYNKLFNKKNENESSSLSSSSSSTYGEMIYTNNVDIYDSDSEFFVGYGAR